MAIQRSRDLSTSKQVRPRNFHCKQFTDQRVNLKGFQEEKGREVTTRLEVS